MKIKREDAVAFMVGLDFPKADSWDNEKLVKYLNQAPDKKSEEDFEGEDLELFKGIKAAKGQIEIIGDSPAKKKAEPEPADEEDSEETETEKTSKRIAKSEKPAKIKKEKPVKAPKAEKNGELHFKEGSLHAKVHEALTKDWQEVEELQKLSPKDSKEIYRVLSSFVRKGIAEKNWVLSFKLAPAKK